MSNIKTINLADHINSAIDKINENFVEVMSNAGLTEAEVIALIAQYGGLTESEIRTALASTTLDLGGNKILYSNAYDNKSDLPDASTYHGMFAHVHNAPDTGAYYSHAGQWVKLANSGEVGGASSLDELSDVQLTTLNTGEVLKWDGVKWTNKTDSVGGGGTPGSSSFHATIYTRSDTNPDQPTGGSYDFAANNNQGLLTPPTASDVTWYENLPAAVEGDPTKIWACNYKFVDIQSDTDLIAGGQWSIPYLIGGTPVDNNGQDQYAQLLAYKRSSTTLGAGDQPSVDEGEDVGSFNFDTREYSAPTGWKETPYGDINDGQLYVIGGIASDADGRIDTTILWSDPQIATTGLNGTSVAEIALYKMVERPEGWEPSDGFTGHAPDKPQPTGTLNFGDNTFTRDNSDLWFSSLNAVYAWAENQDPKVRGDIWSSTYSFRIEGDTGSASVENPPGWSEPVPEIIQSISTYRASLYLRKSRTYDADGNIEPPAAIGSGNTVTYSFTNNEFVKHSDGHVEGASLTDFWYESPPALDLDDPQDLWEVSTVASLVGWYGADGSLTFTQPKLSVNYAIDAENGYSFLQLNLYKWSTTPLGENDKPANDYATFDFEDKSLSVPTGASEWKKVIPDNPDQNNNDYKLYVTTGVASTQPPAGSGSDEPLTEDNDISWSIPDETTAGGAGRDGRSSYLVRIVKKHVVTEQNPLPSTPTGGVVNFGQNSIDPAAQNPVIDTSTLNTSYLVDGNIPGNSVVPPAGWDDHVSDLDPNEAGAIFESELTFAINGDTGYDLGGTGWCVPYEDHNNGEDGYSSFSGQIYIRSPEQPNTPTGGVYSFLSDVMTSLPNGSYGSGDDAVDLGAWTEDAPASNSNGDPLWMSRTTATSKDLDGTDVDLTWTDPVKISTDGSSAIVLDLTNENHSITAQNDGTLYTNSLVGAETTVQAFLGDTAIPLTASQVDITIVGDTVTKGTGVNQVNWSESGLKTTITHVGKNVDEVSLQFSVPSLNKSTVFSLTKVKAGPNGEPPTVYRLVLSASVVKANSTKTSYTPATITATAMKYTGGMPPVAANSTDGVIIKRTRNGSSTISQEDSDGSMSYTISDNTTESAFQLWAGAVKVDEETIPVVIEQPDPGEINVTIPRTETGYLYYTEASAQAPSISATRFTFTRYVDPDDPVVDGTFTGLEPLYDGTTNPKWALSPAGTDLTGNRWAVKFIANETLDTDGNPTGYSEGEDLMFSAPFQSYSFDGLVTFQNTNNIFTTENNVTVIDGGKIKTNSITADQIDTSTLTVNPDWNDLAVDTSPDTVAGEHVVITSEGIKVYSAGNNGNGVLRVKLGKLS